MVAWIIYAGGIHVPIVLIVHTRAGGAHTWDVPLRKYMILLKVSF
jgi:hypothetical protein